jgi:hypothetical protein
MFNLSVLHAWFKTWMESVYVQLVWFKTFGWNLPVCTICPYFMSGSKLGLNHPVCSICQYFMSGSKFWMESPCMFKLSILHVWFKTFGWNHPVNSNCLLHVWLKMFGLNHPVCSICQYFMSGSKLGWNHPVCLICQYFMSGSKLLDRIILYVQLVSTSYLVQNFWMESCCMFNLSTSCLVQQFWIESPCMFNLSVLHA